MSGGIRAVWRARPRTAAGWSCAAGPPACRRRCPPERWERSRRERSREHAQRVLKRGVAEPANSGPAGDDHRGRFGHRARAGAAALPARLPGGHRRHRRSRSREDRRVAVRAGPAPGARCARRRRSAALRRGGARMAAGKLAAVFNNAGVAVASSVRDAVPEDDDWLIDINFRGVVNGTRAFLPILLEQDEGVIVNTSSVFGLVGMPYQSAYCASKFAVRGFTDALRQELRGTGVRAVNVHPGGVTTNIARNARVRKDPEGLGRTKEQMAAQFEAVTLTSPDKAAEIIHRGVERGKARILVGPDAYMFDALARVAPTHYYSVIERLQARLRARQKETAG